MIYQYGDKRYQWKWNQDSFFWYYYDVSVKRSLKQFKDPKGGKACEDQQKKMKANKGGKGKKGSQGTGEGKGEDRNRGKGKGEDQGAGEDPSAGSEDPHLQ